MIFKNKNIFFKKKKFPKNKKTTKIKEMENEKIFYNPDHYLETMSGNKISKKNLIKGLDQIQPAGKVIMQEKSIIRGDLGTIKMGKYVILEENVTLRPTYKRIKA